MMNDTSTMRNEVRLIQKGATWRGFRPGVFLDPAELAHVGAPTLWITGANDPFGSPDLVRGWAGHMPRADVRVMADSGHLPWLDDPEQHAEMIGAFWARVA
jgi:pimeloyl-ACP methyl ester carboxylesterase